MSISWPRDHVFPHFSEVEKLYVVDLSKCDFHTDYKHLIVSSLQGLSSREVPQIYVIYKEVDKWWLELLKKHNIKIEEVSFDFILDNFVNYARGCVVFDPKLPDTVNIATTMAGLYDLVVVHPNDVKLLEEKGLDIKEDLRNKFKDRFEAYLWAYNNLWSKCEHRILVPMSPGPPICTHNPMQVAVRDYVIALKLFAHYLDPRAPHERELFIKLLEDMPNNTALLGWFEEEEIITVHLASIYNKFVVVMTHHYGPLDFANPTVWSGIRVNGKFKLPPIRIEKLGGKRVYVTFYVTDGDNIHFDYNLIKFWKDKNRGKVPIAWTVSPFLVDLAPFILRYYSSTASDNDCFVSGPSGAGYWYPLANPRYADEFLELCKKYFELSGLKFTEILGYSDSIGKKYSEKLDIIAIKKEYNEYPLSYFYLVGNCFYYLDNVPVLFGVIHYSDKDVEGFLRVLKKIKEKSKGLTFILVVSQPWNFESLEKVSNVVNKLSEDHEISVVNFHEFCTLINVKYGLKFIEEKLKELGKIKGKERIVSAINSDLKVLKELIEKGEHRKAVIVLNEAFYYLKKLIS